MSISYGDSLLDIGRARSDMSRCSSVFGRNYYGVEMDQLDNDSDNLQELDAHRFSRTLPRKLSLPIGKEFEHQKNRRIHTFPEIVQNVTDLTNIKKSLTSEVPLDTIGECTICSDATQLRRLKRKDSRGLLNKTGLYGIPDLELDSYKG